jgi:hypothetical protein
LAAKTDYDQDNEMARFFIRGDFQVMNPRLPFGKGDKILFDPGYAQHKYDLSWENPMTHELSLPITG